ncbi:hypothetical protein L1987_64956 [Smallanthus sonchifolius]|uniref:Uncharacterized protein n=1 Tax=Smallanthus sonchifolius TaxID=185202 RepID=A0ACB9BT49_9ASTR|nr:hypothetical protein L1987_64956 [Smallanthus sonchifolius]
MKLLSLKLLLTGGEAVEQTGFGTFFPVTEKDTVTMSGTEAKFTSGGGGDVEFVRCECCGLTEECTTTYITAVRESNQGRWICGLCVEAVKDEMERSCSDSEEEALDRHMRFCKNFRSSNPTEDLISAVKQLLIRSLDSPCRPVSRRIPLLQVVVTCGVKRLPLTDNYRMRCSKFPWI